MNSTLRNPPVSKPMLWTGRILSGLVILFLFLDGAIKVIPLPVVNETLIQLGYSGDVTSVARGIGVLTLVIGVLYAFPRTAILGAILLTGLLGGAMATHLRVGSPVFSHFLFGLYVGLMAWGGLYLRSPELRAILFSNSNTQKV
jgi:DoxX-like family